MLDNLAKALNVTTIELISCERNITQLSTYDFNDTITEFVQLESKRSKNAIMAGICIFVLTVMLLISLVGNIFQYYTHPPRMKIVDEYYDNNIGNLDYEHIYRIIVDYDGRMTDDDILNFPEQIRSLYNIYFVNVDAIVITYYSDYKGRDYVDNYYAMSIMLPTE